MEEDWRTVRGEGRDSRWTTRRIRGVLPRLEPGTYRGENRGRPFDQRQRGGQGGGRGGEWRGHRADGGDRRRVDGPGRTTAAIQEKRKDEPELMAMFRSLQSTMAVLGEKLQRQ